MTALATELHTLRLLCCTHEAIVLHAVFSTSNMSSIGVAESNCCRLSQGNGSMDSAALANGVDGPHDNANVDDGGLNNLAHVAKSQ